jgi:hypothetical protein
VNGVGWLETDAHYSGYTDARAAALYDDLHRRAATLPGVQAATVIAGPPMQSKRSADCDRGWRAGGECQRHLAGAASSTSCRSPILFGARIDRARSEGESAGCSWITESMARKYFGGINAVGRRFRVDQSATWMEVVGVVRDTGTNDPSGDLTDPHPEAFFRAIDQAEGPGSGMRKRAIAARTSGGRVRPRPRPAARTAGDFDPTLPVFSAMTMGQQIEAGLAAPRGVAMSVGALGALGIAACRRRALCGDRVRGLAAREGDRHPHGPWCTQRGRRARRGARRLGGSWVPAPGSDCCSP